ncbi:MAG TPA: hypothetical protein P5119_11485 [Candidatus Aminicenantes bacterium]|nr:hypothetical protein [Candidatus Aminicenantes bacterium]HRY65945.1 hypothetical protein [Candidatus Aminicenantes bacterium]HRZ73006.1 hypothetical protein [Candidatus Aminicenantes bacterium]
MKRLILALLAAAALGAGGGLPAQFTATEQAAYDEGEDFLRTARIVGEERLTGRMAVTQPWVLTLEKDGVRQKAVWKDVLGERVAGFKETWKGEIAAYRLSRALGLHMVPPTVEREFRGRRGSCQLWVAAWNNLETIMKAKLVPPVSKATSFARALCLQRAFDNLIYNIDRHQRNYLVTEDWRIVLIDHSRSFGTARKLIYDEKYREGPNFIMASLPRGFVEALRSLTEESLRSAVGEYLSGGEVAAVMARRDLIVAWLDKRIAAIGEVKVLY